MDNSGNDELLSLGYNSSQPDFTAFALPSETRAQNEVDLPALQRVSKILKERSAYFASVSSLQVDEVDFTVKQQLLNNQRMLSLINELEGLINRTVKETKEKMNG
jgi:hypothetical protein